METDVLDYLRRGYTAVCASSRLARRLQYRYAQSQISAGHDAWATPDILPWTAWLQRCWDEMTIKKDRNLVLLRTEQQLYIWQKIIQRSSHARQLLQLPATARLALNAWNIMHEWQIPLCPEGSLNEDAVAFRAWVKTYQQYIQDKGLIDTTAIPDLLLNDASRVTADIAVVLAGFDDLTPVQQHLISGLGKAGMEFHVIATAGRNISVTAVGAADARLEIRAAALWCRRLLESGVTDNIGVVVQDPRSLHARLQDTFDDVLVPGSILAGNERGSRPFSIIQGLSLNRYPLIKTALDILELGDLPVALELLSSVIRSPFTRAGETESQDRARFDACLRKHGEHRMALKSLDYYAGRYLRQGGVPGVFLELCRNYLEAFRGTGGKRPVYEWAGVFTGLLNRFGWPGDRKLNSAEYQIVSEWRNLMERFASLDPAFNSLNYREALGQLKQFAVGTGFQPETGETPVQIMGMAGAAGMQFDHLWVMGLDEESWPNQAHPNPFIPIGVQRDAGIPGATAAAALMQATRDMDRLIQSTREIILSYPAYNQDRPLRPSPLIRQYLQPDSVRNGHGQDYAAIQFGSRRLTDCVDDTAPAIPEGESVSGGTALFADQAACPFRACARHRLYAEGVEYRDIGLDARERGSIMHDVMQRLWGKLQDHATLLAVWDRELDDIINQSVSSALSPYRKKYPVTFTDSFNRLEAARIGAVVHDWLELVFPCH